MEENMSPEGQSAAIRQYVPDHDLAEKVQIVIAELIEKRRKFTAYTVTTVLRTKRPDLEIAHERVRPIVRDTMFWSDELRTGEWEKQDGVVFEGAKGPARLYYPTGELGDQMAPHAPEVWVLLSNVPSPFEAL